MNSGDDSDGCASSTFELGVDDRPQKFLDDVEISVCATGKNLNRTRLMDMAMARCDRRLRMILNLWRQPGRCAAGGLNSQGGNGGVPLADGSRAPYYSNTNTGEPDWGQRPTWKRFSDAFIKIALLSTGNTVKDKSAYMKLAKLLQTSRVELHNLDFFGELIPLLAPGDTTVQVVDFRTIEIYIDTLAKKNATKMKLAKDQGVYAKVFKAYEKGNNLNLQEAFVAQQG